MIELIKHVENCEGCEGSGWQINDFGFVRMCPECASSHKQFTNIYGTDSAEHPGFYIDQEKGIFKRVTQKDKDKGYIIFNGKDINLNE